MKLLLIPFLAILCAACGQFKAAEIDKRSGYFGTNTVATTVTSKIINLDEYKAILLIPDNEFMRGHLENIGYFDQLITREELATIILNENLQDEVPSVKDKIGLNLAYEHYEKFLWFRIDNRGKAWSGYWQFILTNPGTLEDIFVAEVKFESSNGSFTDEKVWLPLFNSLIQYIKANSWTYRK